MGEVVSMVFKKSDCQGESLKACPRAVDAAHALSVCVRLMQEEFGDKFAMESLANEVMRVKGRK